MGEAKVHVSMEQCIIIRFLTKEGCKQSEICSRLKRQYSEKMLSNVSVCKWSSVFKKGKEMVENEPHEHWPRTSITGENSDRVHTLIQENRQITVHGLSGILNISDGSVKTIIKQHLQYSKVCARWILRLLMDEHKSTWLQVVQSSLSWHKQEGDFLDSITTTDETRMHYFMPESKRSSMQWHHPGSPKPQKAKTTFSAGKVMTTIFWDSKGVLYVDFLT